MNRLGLGSGPAASGAAAALAFYVSPLSFGLVNSVEAVLFPCLVATPLLYLMVAGATAAALALCAVCYGAIIRSLSPEELDQAARVGCLLAPALFFFAAQLYILRTSYTEAVYYDLLEASLPLENLGRHAGLLLLQALGLGALLCTLCACRHLCRSLEAQARADSLAQAARAQQRYLEETQARYRQTSAFRHDIKNHLTVLAGLVDRGDREGSRAYLQRLEAVSGRLSFPCRTGQPVADILLGEKLALAKAGGIDAQASMLLPQSWNVDQLDLCVIFANALDNAITACRAAGEGALLRVDGERQGDFYRFTFGNSCPDRPLPPPGTGLGNIRAAAEKYHGAVLAEQTGGWFSLDVLLNISLPPRDISGKSP